MISNISKTTNILKTRIRTKVVQNKVLKSLGPIDRNFFGHGRSDGFVLYEYIIKQYSNANIQT